jgi:hypothetical protein
MVEGVGEVLGFPMTNAPQSKVTFRIMGFLRKDINRRVAGKKSMAGWRSAAQESHGMKISLAADAEVPGVGPPEMT